MIGIEDFQFNFDDIDMEDAVSPGFVLARVLAQVWVSLRTFIRSPCRSSPLTFFSPFSPNLEPHAPDVDPHYTLLSPTETVLVRTYSEDIDDRLLDELKPLFVIMYEPCLEFVRRIEVGLSPSFSTRSSLTAPSLA